ncbi:MAG TPA: hypothetical protein PK228_14525 [Saprospiraceae bacterium]|nr:hypothetical protein [Saprospiraceae bacterium]
MKRIFIFVIILQFATGHNLVAELVRMPSLLEHFQTHRQETPDLSFARFLWMHYSETSHSHTDNSHAQLPLHCSHGVMAESVLPQPPAVGYVFSFPAPQRISLPLHAESLLPNDYSFGLFRPPIA